MCSLPPPQLDINNQDTLIEQSVTLIKQSQCYLDIICTLILVKSSTTTIVASFTPSFLPFLVSKFFSKVHSPFSFQTLDLSICCFKNLQQQNINYKYELNDKGCKVNWYRD